MVLTPRAKVLPSAKPGEAKADAAAESGSADAGLKKPGRPATAAVSGKKGTVYTMAHPPTWDMGDLFKAVQKHKVRAVHDARPAQTAGPTPEALRVAFSSDNIAYEREPALSAVYGKLLPQARGELEDCSRPCVLLDGRAGWKLTQHRRCIDQYLITKGMEVKHLLWSGDIDHEATKRAGEEAKRDVPVKPDPPKFPVPKVAAKVPSMGSMPMAPTSKAPSAAPKALGYSAFSAPSSKAPAKATPTLPLKPTAKASSSFSSADASPKAVDMLKSKPKASSPEDLTGMMKPKPKGGGTPSLLKPSSSFDETSESDAKRRRVDEGDGAQPTVAKKWGR